MEVKRRYSRQRECILNALRSTTSHPSANSVYDEVRKEIPNISLGTVYRNLAELTADGIILKINAGDGVEHYDGCIKPHYHMFCKGCRAVSDVEIEYHPELDKKAEEISGADIETHNVIFIGTCRNCKNKK